MPMCGFNQKMIEGLEGFHNGLIEHGIIDRSKKKNQTTDQTIKKELSDMDRFLKEIHRIEDPDIRELTKTLAEYTRAFYKFIDKKGFNNHAKIMRFLTDFYFKMDKKFYSELEGKPDDMKQLAEYLNTLKMGE